jgi:hypothetical protein
MEEKIIPCFEMHVEKHKSCSRQTLQFKDIEPGVTYYYMG